MQVEFWDIFDLYFYEICYDSYCYGDGDGSTV